jgi:nucleoside-diphosphate-sugar epimerase
MKIAIAGASGNLGLFLSKFLSERSHDLILLIHKRKLPKELIVKKNVCVKNVDLDDPASLRGSCDGAECIISMAGVLFKGGPEKFLPITNTKYVANLVKEAVSAKVSKFVLLSFPHVEGETFPDSPASGLIPAEDPELLHAKTRLDAERQLIATCESSEMRNT